MNALLLYVVAPVLVPISISLVYFRQSPSDQALGDRLLISAPGVVIATSYIGAMGVAFGHASSEWLAAPFVTVLVLAVWLMQRALTRFRGPRQVHLLQIVNLVCLGWTFFIGGMAITGDAL